MTYYEGSEPYVFLNYAPDDAPTIAPLVELLCEYDFRVWSEMGDGFGLGQIDHIADRLERAHCCICFLTQGFAGSFGCREKMKWALTKNVPIIVICMEDVKLPWGSRLRLWFAKILHDVQYMTPTAFTKMLCNCDLLNACRMTPPIDTIPQTATVSSCVSSSASVDQGLSCSSSVRYSTGLAFRKLDDGTYEVAGKGLCKDKELVIPPTTPDGGKVTRIGGRAFFQHKELIALSIPQGVVSIESNAFRECVNLTTAVLPDSLLSIKEAALCHCDQLQDIAIPSNLITIEPQAFAVCKGQTELVIPHSVTTIGDGAFDYWKELQKVTMPASVTYIGIAPFRYCYELSSIQVGSANPVYYSQDNCVIERRTKKLVIGIRTSQIPSDVTSIGDCAFFECADVTEIKLPQGLTSIGNQAFCGCKRVTEIRIPRGVVEVGCGAFSSCHSLFTVFIPKSVEKIGADAFGHCKQVTIYCEHPTQPALWSPRWNCNNRPVVWGCTI